MRFLDTNVLLYAISKVPEERGKAEIALGLLGAEDLALSVQVLQEFYVQATRAGKSGRLTHAQASLLIESWLRFPVQDTTVELVRSSLRTKERFQLTYWEAAIVEAARALQCEIILSEDLNDGQECGGVRVMNPFRSGK
jgi:predicted nucleic acid-binding protein